jgi:sulfatase modifying factor 1
VAIGVGVVSNTFDGAERTECETQDEVETGRTHETWISFGKAKPQGERGWEAVAATTHCGVGPFDKARATLGLMLGVPYLVVEVETNPVLHPGGEVDLQTRMQIRKLSRFDDKHEPVYARSEQKRRFDLGARDDAIVPLLAADPREKDAFGVVDIFARLTARILGQQAAAYGSVSLTADVPGVDVLLDGGFVGRIPEDGPLVLKNVVVGKHEVGLKDLSGRAASKQVVVEKDRTAEVVLDLLHLPASQTPEELVPIGKNPQGYAEFWRTRDGAVVVQVPAGEFLMGNSAGVGNSAEHPQRQVYVSEFLMDKTEVTWRQFRKYAEATKTPLPPTPLWGTPGDYAVGNVRYDEAQAYCQWVGGRLPTEAEWEKAARGTDGRAYQWGNTWNPDHCNMLDGGSHRQDSVGSFPDCVSPYGLIDMVGGQWEWCADWYADTYPEGPARDPKGPPTGSARVLRGTSWLSLPSGITARQKSDPDWRNVLYGFRCVQPGAP